MKIKPFTDKKAEYRNWSIIPTYDKLKYLYEHYSKGRYLFEVVLTRREAERLISKKLNKLNNIYKKINFGKNINVITDNKTHHMNSYFRILKDRVILFRVDYDEDVYGIEKYIAEYDYDILDNNDIKELVERMLRVFNYILKTKYYDHDSHMKINEEFMFSEFCGIKYAVEIVN
ncbi:MAG: hypothetical protein DSY59_05510 [Persephonella sp.]|nr:MAG: hypothetical protein DSY59_05510 [Persephonella sp.]